MSKIKKSFTLIELLVVIILISVVYFLVIKNYNIKPKKSLSINSLYETTPKNCKIFFFQNGENKINIKLSNPKVFVMIDDRLKQIYFPNHNNKEVVFEYQKHNGIQNSYVLSANNKVFLFTPFSIIEVKNLEMAKNKLLNKQLLPLSGEFYK